MARSASRSSPASSRRPAAIASGVPSTTTAAPCRPRAPFRSAAGVSRDGFFHAGGLEHGHRHAFPPRRVDEHISARHQVGASLRAFAVEEDHLRTQRRACLPGTRAGAAAPEVGPEDHQPAVGESGQRQALHEQVQSFLDRCNPSHEHEHATARQLGSPRDQRRRIRGSRQRLEIDPIGRRRRSAR